VKVAASILISSQKTRGLKTMKPRIQSEDKVRTQSHQQKMIFRFLAHSLTPFGHETAASVTS